MLNIKKRTYLLSATALLGNVAVALAILPQSAAAQEVVVAVDRNVGFDEIVVTARRVEENLQTTPIAVTALSADILKVRQINDVNAIQYSTPNVTIEPLTGNSGAGISIRGMAGVENTSASDPAVGIYVDGVYSARSSLGFLELVDVEQVEVLRGPQGTLFGRNTTGGALNITSPTPEGEFGGRLTARLGEYDTREVLGHVNVPLKGEEVAARIAFKHAEHSGYGYNAYLDRELADLNTNFMRGTLRFAPENSNWDLTVFADYFNRKGNGPVGALFAVNPTGRAEALGLGYGNYLSDDFQTSFSGTETFEDISAKGISATLNIDFGSVQLKSISALRNVKNHVNVDIDGTPYPELAPTVPISGISFEQANEQDYQLSQEFQFFGGGDKLDWIVGLYAFSEKNNDATISTTAITKGNTKNESYAVYGEGNYELTDKMSFNAGLRYTLDRRAIISTLLRTDGVTCTLPAAQRDPAPAVCTLSRDVEFDYLSYNAGLDYNFTGSIFGYVKTSRANRAGGFNHRQIGPPYRPERVTNYEVGLKSQLLDNRLRVNLSVFHMKYDDVQRTAGIFVNGVPTTTTVNAAKATVRGFEAEIDFIANDYFTIGGSLGLIDPAYDTFIDVQRGIPVDRSAEPFTYTADKTFSVYATGTFPVSFGELILHADYGYKGDIYFKPNDAQGLQEGYGLVNLRAALQLDDSGVEFAVFGKNVGNTEYNSYQQDQYNSLGFATGFRGAPSVWGAEVTVQF